MLRGSLSFVTYEVEIHVRNADPDAGALDGATGWVSGLLYLGLALFMK